MLANFSKLAAYVSLISLLATPSFGLYIRDVTQASPQLTVLNSAGTSKVDYTNTTNSVDNTFVLPTVQLQESINGVWSGPISIGTPPQTFNVQYDTGSDLILVPLSGDAKNSALSPDINQYKKSTTGQGPLGNLSPITFRDGDSASGSLFEDVVGIGNGNNPGTVENFPFVAGVLPKADTDNKLSGLVALSILPVTRKLGSNPYELPSFIAASLSQLSHSGGKNMFTFLPTSTGAEFTLGGDHPSVAVGSLNGMVTLPVTTGPNWFVALKSIKVGGSTTNIVISKSVMLDTGANIIQGPLPEVEALVQQINKIPHISITGGQGTYYATCGSLSSLLIKFEFGDSSTAPNTFVVPGNTLLFTEPFMDDICELNLAGQPGGTFWTFGTPVLKTAYSRFSWGTITPPPAGSPADTEPTIAGFSVGLTPLSNVKTA